MPHITIEYTDNLKDLDEGWVMLQLNKAILNTGIFMDPDVKTRMHKLNSYRMGVESAESGQHGFVAARVELLSGREFSVKENLGQVVLKSLGRTCCPDSSLQVQISVHVTELESELYFKSISKPD